MRWFDLILVSNFFLVAPNLTLFFQALHTVAFLMCFFFCSGIYFLSYVLRYSAETYYVLPHLPVQPHIFPMLVVFHCFTYIRYSACRMKRKQDSRKCIYPKNGPLGIELTYIGDIEAMYQKARTVDKIYYYP